MIRFLGTKQLREAFLRLSPDARDVFFSGFKVAVLECLRSESAEVINEALARIDKDYDEVVATGTHAPKQRI